MLFCVKVNYFQCHCHYVILALKYRDYSKLQISYEVIKAYIRAGGYKLFFLVILFQLVSIAGQVFTNIWLSAWSDDANDETTATAQQSRKRLMVYGILASITGKI